jgi:hypothetical protein
MRAGPRRAARKSARPGRCERCTWTTRRCSGSSGTKASGAPPGYNTRSRVYYKNLDRLYKAFIGGSLAGEIDGVEECVAGARLVLKRGTQTVAETKSDAFGDFKFQALEEESGAYRLEIADERFAPKTIGIALGRSTYLGTISLERRSAVPA